MHKEVRISIQGLQMMETSGDDRQEQIVSGEYYYRAGKHYLLYEEREEGTNETTACRIKCSSDRMEVTRKGTVCTTLVFEPGRQHRNAYHTPYGTLELGTDTTRLCLTEKEELIEVEAEYALAMDGERVSQNKIHITVTNK